MQRTFIALLLFLFTLPVWAQAPIPGTFNRTQPHPNTDLYAVPVITTPQISFGSGLTPPVVVTGQTTLVSSPRVEYEPSVISNQENENEEQPAVAYSARLKPMRLAPFDFVVAPTDGVALGESSEEAPSLAEQAAALRKGPPPTQRNFTNDDINRMNQSSGGNFAMPAGNAPQQEQPQAQPTNPKPPKDQSQDKPRSPFAPQVSAEE